MSPAMARPAVDTRGGGASLQGEAGLPTSSVLAHHQAALDAGRFLIQRCTACGRHVYYPRVGCPHCGSTALAWVDAKGTGHVHAVTTVRRKATEETL
jgi:uncharacterized OB-fold protein